MILLLTIALEILRGVLSTKKDNEFKEVENEDPHFFI
jgi:hypothetical protein